MKKLIAVAALAMVAAGCSKDKDNTALDANSSPEACLALIDVSQSPTIFAEDAISGKPGTYRLVEQRTFGDFNSKSLVAHIAGTTKISKYADPSKSKIDSKSSVLCANVANIPDGYVNANAESPIAFSQEDGTIPSSLKYMVKSKVTQYGSRADVVVKQSFATEASSTYFSGSVLAPDPYSTAKRTVHQIDATTVALRVEKLEKESKMVTISIYVLTN